MGNSVGGLIKTLVSSVTVKSSQQKCKRSRETPASLAVGDTVPATSALPLEPCSSWEVFGSPGCPVPHSQAAEVLLGLALWEEGRSDCRGKHLSVQLMGSLGEEGQRDRSNANPPCIAVGRHCAFLSHQRRSRTSRKRFMVVFIYMKGSPHSVSNGDKT